MKAMLLAALAGLFWGVGEVCTKQVLHSGKIGPLTAIAVRSTVALPLLWGAWLIFVKWRAVEPVAWTQAGPKPLLLLILGSGVVAGAAAMLCFYGALHLGPISKVKPVAFCLAPAVGVMLGWLLLGESMTPRKVAAIGLILGGVVLLTFEP